MGSYGWTIAFLKKVICYILREDCLWNLSRTIVENSQGNFVPPYVLNSWRMCINYRKLNEVTLKGHFPLPFLDQNDRTIRREILLLLSRWILWLLSSNTHSMRRPTQYNFYMWIWNFYIFFKNVFWIMNASTTFQWCMLNILTGFIWKCIEVFMDDFTIYGNNFDSCLNSLELILKRYMYSY